MYWVDQKACSGFSYPTNFLDKPIHKSSPKTKKLYKCKTSQKINASYDKKKLRIIFKN